MPWLDGVPGPITQGTVAARIEQLESAAPIVYPLHVNPFKRRTGGGTLAKPVASYAKTPTNRAQASLPELRPVTPPQPKTNRRVPPTLFSPADYLHGTRDRCVRHGRKPFITGDGFEKGRNGAYYPTGITNRRNVEATSPWAPRADNSCPDCVAEMGYKRREQLQTVLRPEKLRESPTRSVATTAQSKDFGSPLIPVAKTMPSEVLAPAPKSHHWLPGWLHKSEQPSPFNHDESTVIQHLNALSPKSITSDNLVTTEDLGDGLDAAILERHGRLERVVLNRRHGEGCTAETLLRLARDLLTVAQTLQSHAEPPQQLNPPVIKVEKPLESVSDAPLDIRKKPNPYFHAPAEPRSLHYGQWQATKALGENALAQATPVVHMAPVTHWPPSPSLIATPDLTPSLRSTSPNSVRSNLSATKPPAPFQHSISDFANSVQSGFLHNPFLDIRKNPNPYFHAPPEPRSLHFAQWADKQVQAMQQGLKDAAKFEEQKVKEAQQMITDGFRMERRATLKQAAEWEKHFRRQSASGSAKPAGGIWGIFT